MSCNRIFFYQQILDVILKNLNIIILNVETVVFFEL